MLSSFAPLLFLILTVHSQEDPNLKHIHYYHYPDESNAGLRTELNNVSNSTSIKNSLLTRDTGIKVIVHGAQGMCNKTDFPLPTVSAYLKAKKDGRGNDNVICVEYFDFTIPTNNLVPQGLMSGNRYVVNTVGNQTAKLILEMKEFGFLNNFKNVHIIGHSLGAHVSAGIGRKINQITNYTQKVGRISGLDPGNPIGFTELDLDILLDLGDADFVDVYHTDEGRLGQKGKIGQVDFYIDGGESQRICQNQPNLVDRLGEITLGVCSHLIVGKYWAKSVEDQSLQGCKATSWKEYQELSTNGTCNDPVVFGEGTSRTARDRYYLYYPGSSDFQLLNRLN